MCCPTIRVELHLTIADIFSSFCSSKFERIMIARHLTMRTLRLAVHFILCLSVCLSLFLCSWCWVRLYSGLCTWTTVSCFYQNVNYSSNHVGGKIPTTVQVGGVLKLWHPQMHSWRCGAGSIWRDKYPYGSLKPALEVWTKLQEMARVRDALNEHQVVVQ